MADELFGRRVVVEVLGVGGALALSLDSGTYPDQQFHLSFTAEKSLTSSVNEAHLTAWNLSRETVARLREARPTIRLRAGYGDPDLIFTGQLTSARRVRNGADVVAEIDLGDGYDAVQTATLSQTWPGGTPAAKMLLDAAFSFGLPLGESDVGTIIAEAGDVGASPTLVDEFVHEGSTRELLDLLARTYRFEWSVQDGALVMLPLSRPLAGEVVRLSPSSGLVDQPSPMTLAAAESGRVESIEGVQFAALMTGRIRPGALVSIEAEDVDGIFRVERCSYSADSHSGPFLVEGEGRRIAGLRVV